VTELAGVWLYAVAENSPAAGLDQLIAVDGGPVRAIAAAGLTAIVSDAGLDEFGESALRVNLEDMAWLEATATAHHRVIDAISRAQPVVPMRLATVYSGDAKIRAMLSQRGKELREVLRRISARKEWGVKAYVASTPGAAAVAHADGSDGGAAGSGAEYLRRRRDELAVRKQTKHEALVSAERAHRALSQLACASRLHPPQSPLLAGTKAPMILNGAYLLEEAGDRQFSEMVHELAGQYPAITLQLTGPWPPYSFASLDEGKDGSTEEGR
jgi:Gas vesicle synthesis protein GvpL/GvpF